MPGRGTQESGEGPGATWDGESRPESSTFSGDEEEKGEGLEVKPRLLEPGVGKGTASSRPHSHGVPSILPQATPMSRKVRPHSMSPPPYPHPRPCCLATFTSTDACLSTHCHPHSHEGHTFSPAPPIRAMASPTLTLTHKGRPHSSLRPGPRS